MLSTVMIKDKKKSLDRKCGGVNVEKQWMFSFEIGFKTSNILKKLFLEKNVWVYDDEILSTKLTPAPWDFKREEIRFLMKLVFPRRLAKAVRMISGKEIF